MLYIQIIMCFSMSVNTSK